MFKDQNQAALLSPIYDCGRDKCYGERETVSRCEGWQGYPPEASSSKNSGYFIVFGRLLLCVSSDVPYPHRPLSVMPSHPKFHAFSSVWHLLNKRSYFVTCFCKSLLWSEFSLPHRGHLSLESLESIKNPVSS